jgi:hypothetical protein
MTSISTPDSIIEQLVAIRDKAERGPRAQYDAEVKAIELELAAEKLEMTEFIKALGPVAHREAVAKLKSADARLAAEIARAEHQRIKTSLRQLELSQSNLQTQARLVEITYRTAGIGER